MKSLFILFISIFWGCASTQNAVQQDEQQDKNDTGIVEDFDPATLGDIEYVVEPKFGKEQKASGAERYLNPGENNQNPSVEEEIINVPGFRIQIGSMTNQEDASEIEREAMLQFEDANVYLEFETPYYKIRVGDFEHRHDAEALQKKAVGLGYGDAWIVRTTIEKKSKTP